MSSPLPPPIHLIMDTDVGFDDVFALSMILWRIAQDSNQATLHPIQLHAVSIVKGLQMKTQHGAAIVDRLIRSSHIDTDQSIRIFAGSEKRMLPEHGHCFSEGEWFTEEYASKTYNLADILQLDPLSQDSNDYPNLSDMITFLKDFPDQYFTIVCTGPLTNMARLIEMDKDIITRKVSRIVIMGGSLFNDLETDVLPNGSEWNFYCDGKAAEIVLGTFGTRVDLMSMFVANLKVLTNEQIEILGREVISDEGKESVFTSNRISDIMRHLLKVSFDSYAYDPVAVSSLLNPSMFDLIEVSVMVFSEKPKEGLIEESVEPKCMTIRSACGFRRDQYFELLQSMLGPIALKL